MTDINIPYFEDEESKLSPDLPFAIFAREYLCTHFDNYSFKHRCN